jgi:hypothetical protein
MIYDHSERYRLSAGVAHKTSPVDDKDRTIDMPLDKQVKLSVGYGNQGR